MLSFRNYRDFSEIDKLLNIAIGFLKNGLAYKTLLRTTSLTPCEEVLFQKFLSCSRNSPNFMAVGSLLPHVYHLFLSDPYEFSPRHLTVFQ